MLSSESVEIIPIARRRASFAEAQYCVRVGGFVAGAGSRDVATLGGGECRCDSGTGVSAGVVFRGWGCETAWQAALLDVLALACFGDLTRLTGEFWTKSRTNRSF